MVEWWRGGRSWGKWGRGGDESVDKLVEGVEATGLGDVDGDGVGEGEGVERDSMLEELMEDEEDEL